MPPSALQHSEPEHSSRTGLCYCRTKYQRHKVCYAWSTVSCPCFWYACYNAMLNLPIHHNRDLPEASVVSYRFCESYEALEQSCLNVSTTPIGQVSISVLRQHIYSKTYLRFSYRSIGGVCTQSCAETPHSCLHCLSTVHPQVVVTLMLFRLVMKKPAVLAGRVLV